MRYFASDSGAVTVDWVVLTAGLVGLGLATMSVVSTGTQDASDDIEGQLANNIVSSHFIGSEAHFHETTPVTGCGGGDVAAYGEAWVDAGSTWQRVVDADGFKQAHLDNYGATYAAMTTAEKQAELDRLNTEAGSAYDANTGQLDADALLYGDDRVARPAFHLLQTVMLECDLASG